MAQFDIYQNDNSATRNRFPYLLDIQHPLHENTRTRMIIPLTDQLREITMLTPTIEVEQQFFVAIVPEMVGMDRSFLGKKIANAEQYRSTLINAVDLLITGF